jgi:electron transfer flavoprotein beta subunit
MLPYLLGEALQRPVLNDVLALSLHGDALRATQYLPKGQRRELACALPAVVAVHPRAQPPSPYAWARAQQGRVVRHDACDAPLSPTRIAKALSAPRPLVAASQASAHERMLNAIQTDEGGRQGLVVKNGDPVEKAQVLLDYLREHHLVDF